MRSVQQTLLKNLGRLLRQTRMRRWSSLHRRNERRTSQSMTQVVVRDQDLAHTLTVPRRYLVAGVTTDQENVNIHLPDQVEVQDETTVVEAAGR